MAEDNAGGAVAEDAGGLDELGFFEADDLAADDAGHGEPFHRADGGEEADDFAESAEVGERGGTEHGESAEPVIEVVHGLFEKDHHEDDEDGEREGVEDIDYAHHEAIQAAADVAGEGTVGDADEEGDERGHEADHEGDAAAVEDAGEEVAAVDIGAEPVVGGRGGGTEGEVLFEVGKAEKGGEQEAGGGEDEDDGAAEEGEAIFA